MKITKNIMSRKSKQLREQNVLDNVIVMSNDMPIKVNSKGVITIRKK
jgi:hypothetical protein